MTQKTEYETTLKNCFSKKTQTTTEKQSKPYNSRKSPFSRRNIDEALWLVFQLSCRKQQQSISIDAVPSVLLPISSSVIQALECIFAGYRTEVVFLLQQ